MKPRWRNGELDYFIPTSLCRYSIETVPKRSLFCGFGLSRGMSRKINDRSTAGKQEGITYKIRALNLLKWRSPCNVNLKKGKHSLEAILKKKKRKKWRRICSIRLLYITTQQISAQTERRFDCIYTSILKSSLREHPIFSALVSSSSGGREATTGNMPPVRRLPKRALSHIFITTDSKIHSWPKPSSCSLQKIVLRTSAIDN